jgi:polyphenol oxidase
MPTAHVLRSGLLDAARVPHAFSTRLGGVSSGIFSSLNFGNPSELLRESRDPATNIAENLRRLQSASGCSSRDVAQVHQVHGSAVHIIRERPRGISTRTNTPTSEQAHTDPKADAIISTDTLVCPMIRIADCAPILLASHDGHIVAAVHAGWRGVIAGVASETMRAMRNLGAKHILAAIGPCIGVEHFEVGTEVAEQFAIAFPNDPPMIPAATDAARAAGKVRVDLRAALERQLRAAGIDDCEHIGGCTFADPSLYFSHRRDNGLTGRLAAIIAPRADT